MSEKYPGGIVRGTPVVPSGPYENSTAPGIWTLDQATNYIKQGIWPTAGNVNPDAFIENLFQTWLYTGNGSTQTITNGIDLSTKGGLVWIKGRSIGYTHVLVDTARGTDKVLCSNNTNAQQTSDPGFVTQFNTNGFAVGDQARVNLSSLTVASWTFRKQPKFFDVVTYTGNGVAGRAISHSLGSVPGCIILKNTAPIGSAWKVWHRSANGGQSVGTLNATVAFNTTDPQNYWGNNSVYIAPTSTTFTISNDVDFNNSGDVYVAYIFAHDAGGFGLTGTDNVISCGSYTGNGSTTGPTITLGYEPQWVMIKNASSTGDWVMQDVMRGMPVGGNTMTLFANLSNAEVDPGNSRVQPTATGFQIANTASASLNASGNTYIYIAIRRGPMKTPTTGTSVFQPTTWTGTGAALQQNVNINYDSFMQWRRNGGYSTPWMDRLRGFGYSLYTQQTTAEVNQTAFIAGTIQNNFVNFVDGTYNLSGEPWLNYAFVRAPGFFDVVCYTGDAADPRSITHNLTATPELMIVKRRDASANWRVYSAATGATNQLFLNLTDASAASSGAWSNTAPTSSAFTVGFLNNASGATYVAYLFASVAGVSKVGTYTGTGALQTINCGFTGGARFVLIKRTDSTGDWWVYDSARGISSGNDPYLFINSTAAEVTGTNYVDTTSVGFQVTAAAPAGLNANGGTYIFLAIA